MEDEGEESIENLEDTKGNTARVWVQLAAPRREIKYRWGIKKSYLLFFPVCKRIVDRTLMCNIAEFANLMKDLITFLLLLMNSNL